ncbi:hypothetical protein Pcinc_037591 [Petrolisthes cinctipes]|uniref:Uncharacterized protein n=1 Tax=Petrolisthes cinctipes TaxID=88211 RepID=A0AAE1BSH0_PETCI|nr:hypothetical protein Pcinc_037591 [Petrolisthes cinctipes]
MPIDESVSGGTTTSPPEPSAAVTTTATLWALAANFRSQTRGDIIEEEEQGRSWASQRGMAVFTSTVAGTPRINLSQIKTGVREVGGEVERWNKLEQVDKEACGGRTLEIEEGARKWKRHREVEEACGSEDAGNCRRNEAVEET